MSNSNTIHVNDIGTEIEITIYQVNIIDGDETEEILDISDYITLTFKARHNSGKASFYGEMNLVTDGTDGKCSFITTDILKFTVAGCWTIQVFYESPNGEWHTTTTTIEVKPILNIA